MFVAKEFSFCASHVLEKHKKCYRMHGHNWRLIVEVTDCDGVMDAEKITETVQPIVDRFNYRHMNCFVRYPSIENVAIHIAHLLRAQLNWESMDRLVVKVSETDDTWAVWDSNLQDDRDIFDLKTLDSAEDKDDADWRSPEVTNVYDVPARIEALENAAPYFFENWQKIQAELEQLYLYRDSIDYKPELPVGGANEDEGEEVEKTSEPREG